MKSWILFVATWSECTNSFIKNKNKKQTNKQAQDLILIQINLEWLFSMTKHKIEIQKCLNITKDGIGLPSIYTR